MSSRLCHRGIARVVRAGRRALPALVLVVSLGVLVPATIAPPAAAARAAGPPYPSKLIVKSELRLKANLVRDNAKRPVQLVFFGGSRSQRFDPVFARRRLGLRAVNLALSNGRPEALWAYANWFYKRWPDANIRWIIGVQPSMMRTRRLDPALLQDARFYGYFPDWLLATQRRHLPSSVSRMPKYYGFLRNRYSEYGLLLRNTYDRRRAAGYTLRQSLNHYIARMLKSRSRGDTASTFYNSRACRYFEKTLQLLNDHGATPVIVLMPVHPRVLSVQRRYHMTGARTRLKEYFASIESTYAIKVLDFTKISSFNGKREWFYDGCHITRSNANRIINEVRAQAGDCLE